MLGYAQRKLIRMKGVLEIDKAKFSHVDINIAKKYDDQKDPRKYLSLWTVAWGVEPQPKLVHMFLHSLDMIP